MNRRFGLSLSTFVTLSTALAIPALIQGTACTGAVVVSTEIGPSGGIVEGPNGARVIIPAGALAHSTSITIRAVPAASAPTLSGGIVYAGDVYAFEPHGLAFDAAVQIRLPLAGGASTASVLHASCPASNAGADGCGPWDAPLGGIVFEPGFATASTKSFSLYAVTELQGTGGAGGAGGAGGTTGSSSTGAGGACMFSSQSSYAVNVAPKTIAVADLNGDGALDLAVAAGNGYGNTVSVLLNAGDGTFAAAVDYPAGPVDTLYMAAGDLTGDGRPDLVVVSLSAMQLNVLVNAGNGTFGAPIAYPVDPATRSLTVADLNGDGALDVILGGDLGLQVLFNTGNGALGAKVAYPMPYQVGCPAVADVNGDGVPDVIVPDPFHVQVMLNAGAGVLSAPVAFAAGPSPDAMAVADLNGDGRPDLVVGEMGPSPLSVLLNAGSGTFSAPMSLPDQILATSVAIGDVDGDGKPDLVVAAGIAPMVQVLLNQGGGVFTAAGALGGALDPAAVKLADLNGDGRLDLVFADASGDTVSVLLQCQ